MSTKLYREQRRVKRGTVTRVCNNLQSDLNSMADEIKTQRIIYLKSLMDDLESLDEKIFETMVEDENKFDEQIAILIFF